MRFNLRNIVASNGPRLPLLPVVFLALVLSGCGGSAGVAQFVDAGSITFEKEIVSDGSSIDLTDPNGRITISGAAGSVQTDAKLKLQIWDRQRSTVTLNNFEPTPVAIDLSIVPASLGSRSLTVEMSGPGGSDLRTMIAAFGADGTRIVLPNAEGSTSSLLKAQLSAEIISFVSKTSPSSTDPIKIQLVLQSVKAAPATSAPQFKASSLTRVWTAPQSRTNYADKKRIAITIHGILNVPADIQDLTDYFGTEQRTERENGAVTDTVSKPFDAVDVFDYDWKQPIQRSGAEFATFINRTYGDKTKYEVHIFAHSMGGLVSRFAIESNGCPAVTQLITFGTPHKGVPAAVLRNFALLMDLRFGTGNAVNFENFLTGVNQLVEGSDAITQLAANSPQTGTKYQAIAGTKSDLALGGVTVGLASHALYTLLGKTPDDGIVPQSSALGGPATESYSVPYNHGALVGKDIKDYWPRNISLDWVPGANRKIKRLGTAFLTNTVSLSNSIPIELDAFDLDENELDPNLIFDPSVSVPQVPLVWTVEDTSIASVTIIDKLKATINGLKVGDTVVTATDPATKTKINISVKVVDGNVLILPNKPSLGFGESKTFTVSLVTGEIAPGTLINWSLSGEGTINGGTSSNGTSPSVNYIAPRVARTDRLTVELRNPTTNQIVGNGGVNIAVEASTVSIDPSSFSISFGQNKSFSAVSTTTFPSGARFEWTVTGLGTLAAGSGGHLNGTTVKTFTSTAPIVNYKLDEPVTQGTSQSISLGLRVIAANGDTIGTSTAAINAVLTPFVIVKQGTKYNSAITGSAQFQSGVNFGTGPADTYSTVFGSPNPYVFDLRLWPSQGIALAAGQSYDLKGRVTPGCYYFFLNPNNGYSGSVYDTASDSPKLNITGVTRLASGQRLVSFHLECKMFRTEPTGAIVFLDPLLIEGAFSIPDTAP